MATKTSSGITTTAHVGNFPVIIDTIRDAAYKMQYENNLLRHLCSPMGQGQKGSMIHWAYFDPSTLATGASTLTEGNDFVNYTQLTNSSVIVTASEFGETVFITDITKEAAIVDIPAEATRQLAIGVAVKLDQHIIAQLNSGFTTGTTTGTNSTNGFQFSDYAKAQQKLDAKALTVPKGTKHAVVPAYSWYYTAKSTFSQTYASAMGDPGNEIVRKWYVQRILGDIDVYKLPLSHVSASSSAVGHMFVSDAVGLWIPRDYRLEQDRDVSARGDEIVSTMRAGAKVLIGGYGVRLSMYASI